MKLFKKRDKKTPRRRQLGDQPAAEIDGAKTFRRGRTLTGSVSPLVNSSNEARADLTSPRVQLHALHKKRRRIFASLSIVAIMTIVVYVLISQFTAQAVIQSSPDPSLKIDSQAYQKAINGYLSNHLGERWRFATSDDHLSDYVKNVAPEVKRIETGGSAGFGKSLFLVTFRQPIASWNVDSKELYVDENGVTFSRNYFASPKLRITDQSGTVAALSSGNVASNRFMSYVGQVIGAAKDKGYSVTTVLIPEGMTRQIEVRVKGVGYSFKLTSDRPAREGVEDMARAIKWMKDHRLTPEYVDVRVEGRAFYK